MLVTGLISKNYGQCTLFYRGKRVVRCVILLDFSSAVPSRRYTDLIFGGRGFMSSFHILGRWFLYDTEGRRAQWKLTYQQRLRDLTIKEEQGSLAPAEKRHEAYRRCKDVRLFDHHSLYVQKVVRSGVGTTYQPYDYAQPIVEVANELTVPEYLINELEP